MKGCTMSNVEKEASKLITDLYGADVAKVRRRLIEFHERVLELTISVDGFVDPIMFELMKSKHTAWIVVTLFGAVFMAGYLLGNL